MVLRYSVCFFHKERQGKSPINVIDKNCSLKRYYIEEKNIDYTFTRTHVRVMMNSG